ncbi:MAG TPA: family 20 glycosylhydrolase, partial [Verrucomicrobiae bacterium]|nr:family 20 glycosylhydrolase [Verrucomicrobiae bacterium]
VLDLMALHKLNTFHWHLVDDQGWRIEIKKYPLLTQVGSWRKQSDIERPITATNAHPAWAEPAASKFGPDGRYGGFYTQDEIRAVVAYAAARHIKIVPEIEMPGHSMAALTAYPQFSCFGGPYTTDNDLRLHTGIYDPSKEATFQFIEGVLTEVFQLFPDKYVHIGGDEVQKRYWHRSADCQALMKREGLKNEEELQSWFIKRIEKFVNAHGKTMIGWSEILQGGLATNAVVMDWIGGGQEAASAGHDVVMTPEAFCYLDHYQSTNHAMEPRAIGGYTPLQKIYLFDPIPTNLATQFQSHVLGAQGNLWVEYVASLPHVEYMIFPRMTALAEVDWSAKDSRNWNDFVSRLKVHEKRLDELDVNYRPGTDEPLNVPSVYHTAHFTTDFIDARISLDYPGFEGLSVDSLGKEQFPMVTMNAPAKPWRATQGQRHGMRVEYRKPGAADSVPPRWAIEVATNEIWLESHWSADDPPEPFVMNADNSAYHVTLLGVMQTNGAMQLPAIMHIPDQGSFRISAEPPLAGALGFAGQYDGKVVQMTFPGATQENPVVKYRWQVAAIHPPVAGIDSDERFDGFRRNWLNIFQFSPHWHMLANHVTSDTCAFCCYEYADIAAQTPPLADGVTALDMVRQTVDEIIGGGKAYGMPGHGSYPEFSADTFPSLLIAAEDYVGAGKDDGWLATNYDHLKSWTDKMLATDTDGDGLIKYNLSGNSGSWPAQIKYRPANWWDTIGFAHEDAYANALAYRALRGMETLAYQSKHKDDQARYGAAADKLKAAYFDAFYNPATGVLAGWRSADGQLHDYYFLFVNGIAIHYGLVPKDKANDIMDHLLAKMKEVGYTRFDLGLPGNLIPVLKKDYVDHNPRFGGGLKDDNTDGFQIYENGGATACFAYFTVAALYDLGRVADGDKIFMPMLDSFAKGDFQGRGTNGMSKDWRTWDGTCWGYEGMLTDNYYALLAVMDRAAAVKRDAH